MRRNLRALVEGIGVAFIAAGLVLVYLPAGLVFAGASILIFVWLEEGKHEYHQPSD